MIIFNAVRCAVRSCSGGQILQACTRGPCGRAVVARPLATGPNHSDGGDGGLPSATDKTTEGEAPLRWSQVFEPAPQPALSDFERREQNEPGALSYSKADVGHRVAPVKGPPGSIQKVATGQILLELDTAFKADPHFDPINIIAYKYAKEGGLKMGAVEYINHALKLMDDHDIKPDLFTYNQLLDVMPKNTNLKNKRLLDVIFPKQTAHLECAMQLMTRMEERGVIPNLRTFKILEAVFGRSSQALQKCEAIAWWFLRIQSDNPYILPESLPPSPLEQAKIALDHLGLDSKGRYRRLSILARLPRSMKTKTLWEDLHRDELALKKFTTTVFRGCDDHAGASSRTEAENVDLVPAADAIEAEVGFAVGMQTKAQAEEMEFYTTVNGSGQRVYEKEYVPSMTWRDMKRDWPSEEFRMEYLRSGLAEEVYEKKFDKNDRTSLYVRGPHLNYFGRKLIPLYTLVEDVMDDEPENGFGAKERVLATCVIDTNGQRSREQLLEEWIVKLKVTATDVVLDLGAEFEQPTTPSLLQRSTYEREEAKRNTGFLQAAVMPDVLVPPSSKLRERAKMGLPPAIKTEK